MEWSAWHTAVDDPYTVDVLEMNETAYRKKPSINDIC